MRASLAIADIYVELERYDDAAAALEQASATGEASAFVANKLGEVRVEQGRDDEAVPLFEQAIAKDDDYALPHFNLGVLYEQARRWRRHRAVQAERQTAQVLQRPVQPRQAVRSDG
jgi:tetratricopeptide (TPR) repeat protein